MKRYVKNINSYIFHTFLGMTKINYPQPILSKDGDKSMNLLGLLPPHWEGRGGVDLII